MSFCLLLLGVATECTNRMYRIVKYEKKCRAQGLCINKYENTSAATERYNERRRRHIRNVNMK